MARKEIHEIFNSFINSLDGQSEEYQKGVQAALKTVIEIGHTGFGGDVVDFADWIEEGMKEGNE